MKRLIALFLLLCMLFGLVACSSDADDADTSDTNDTVAPGSGSDSNDADKDENVSAIVVPEYKDYGRGTVNFSEIIYSRPNLLAVINAFEAAAAIVDANEVTVEEQIEAIRSLEDDFTNVQSMYAIAEIYHYRNASVEFWQSEYTYLITNYPTLSQAVENLLVACARSMHKATLESDYFGYSLDEYKDGGIYTDEVVALMQEESRLEAEYSAISTANVEITYSSVNSAINWSGTVDEVIAKAREHYANDDASYERALMAINLLYEKARQDVERPIYIELIKVRRLIADELGYSSYAELAYDTLGYDFTENDMLALLSDIGKYVAPVAYDLEHSVFYNYFITNPPATLNRDLLINKLYEVYAELGGDYKDAYSYMLQHGLYDVDASADNRFSGAFTTYIGNNASPYLFMTTSGFIMDYMTLSHEFGHFLDEYVNNGNDESIANSEISSQALELLTVLALKDEIHAVNYEYLEYYSIYSYVTGVLLEQSFYATFEHMVYELEYDEITEAKLNKLIEKAFNQIYGDDATITGDLSSVIMPHTMLYPFYVESYVTAGVVSLDIFFKESARTGSAGEGFALYNALIHRGSAELSFEDRLESVGLDSPFKAGKLKEISNSIYYQIIGKTYYKNGSGELGAA